MSIWTLFQLLFNVVTFVGFTLLWLRLRKPPQDDPRLSRGLQLLQTKITVLEDLSDRTDAQVKQLSSLLDHKARVVQNKILEAEQQLLKIDHSMNKSMEVAEIFQDKIPHQEILERQRTVEYVKAARMAHSGLSVEEISESVHLPREQIELIAKFNREQLMFDETQLPEWASPATPEAATTTNHDPSYRLNNMDFVNSLVGPLDQRPANDFSQVEKIGQDFKHAVNMVREAQAAPAPSLLDNRVGDSLRSGFEQMQPAVASLKNTAQSLKDKLVSTAEDILRAPTSAPSVRKVSSTASEPTFTLGTSTSRAADAGQVKKVIFPRIDKNS